jgi:hypothetical protein
MPRARLVKPPTHHIGFDFETGKRIQEQEWKKTEDENFGFHSRPYPTKILKDIVVFLKGRHLQSLSQSQRTWHWITESEYPPKMMTEDEPVVIGAHPVPYYGVSL